ncbi:hypothetical protein I4U23_020782 [Adineta vaga]|nr:hypothetical protein I4U23_020782 [Adineta vaga]
MSFNRSNNCALCTTLPSVSLCEGCQRRFCHSCFNKHRDDLSLELDDLTNRRNELMEVINSHLTNDSSNINPYFDEIKRWQTEMHANIDRIATEARNTVEKLKSDVNSNIQNELDQISKELQQYQKTNGYVENDLNRIKQQLIRLNQTVQQFNNQISIDTSSSKNINWNTMLFVVTNGRPQMNPISTSVLASPNLNNTFNRNSCHTMSLSRQQYSPYTSMNQPSNNYRPNVRSTSLSMGSAPRTYACIGCKTVNTIQENGRNICSVCHCPAPF